jgi:hypothetical protein
MVIVLSFSYVYNVMNASYCWCLVVVYFIAENYPMDIPETATSRSLGMTMVPGNHVIKCLLKSEK